jgi:hypothetical protein
MSERYWLAGKFLWHQLQFCLLSPVVYWCICIHSCPTSTSCCASAFRHTLPCVAPLLSSCSVGFHIFWCLSLQPFAAPVVQLHWPITQMVVLVCRVIALLLLPSVRLNLLPLNRDSAQHVTVVSIPLLSSSSAPRRERV